MSRARCTASQGQRRLHLPTSPCATPPLALVIEHRRLLLTPAAAAAPAPMLSTRANVVANVRSSKLRGGRREAQPPRSTGTVDNGAAI